MKKIALISSVAVFALAGTSVFAGDISHGEWARTVSGQLVTGHTNAAQDLWNNDAANRLNAQTGNLPEISATYFVGSSAGNNGTESMSDGATYSLKGNVTKDCAFYSGSSASHSLDFGTIGIYASDNTGPAAAFDMTGPASVTVYTNLAGCNTSNTVKLTKNSVDGLVNAGNTGGYDTNVFQANLPFTVEAKYTAVAQGSVAAGASTTLSVASTALSSQATHGAWKSPMSIAVNIPVASKSLLAGDYTGSVAVEITAF